MEDTYRLTVACPDQVGIVAAVSGFVARHGGWIVEASHHADQVTGWFFMRNEITVSSLAVSLEQFRREFAPIAAGYAMEWRITDSREPQRVILMGSRESHCMADLLHRRESGELNADIVAVISNHEDLRRMVEWHGIPFHCVPVTAKNRDAAFLEMEALFQQYEAGLVVLARYMQILPAWLCNAWAGRVINIHHSFLPSFAGARPYQQAYERGVKLIGATCHYATQELDDGPIIEQDVIRVSHSDTIEDMIRLGRDVEKAALARGLRAHLEDRVMIHENKTVVFT